MTEPQPRTAMDQLMDKIMTTLIETLKRSPEELIAVWEGLPDVQRNHVLLLGGVTFMGLIAALGEEVSTLKKKVAALSAELGRARLIGAAAAELREQVNADRQAAAWLAPFMELFKVQQASIEELLGQLRAQPRPKR